MDDLCRPLQDVASSDRDAPWLSLLFSEPSQRLVHNVQTQWCLLQAEGHLMPCTINETEYANSYVCSPYTGCILYPQSEVDKIDSRILPPLLRLLAKSMSLPLLMARINRVISLNNWLLSTNLHPSLSNDTTDRIVSLALNQFPTHAIAMRSLNDVTNGEMIRRLRAKGFLMATSRQVYFFDRNRVNYMDRRNTRWDLKLLDSTHYQLVTHEEFTEADGARIEELYRLLYIDKYSIHNPQFTAYFLEECRRRRLLTMWGLRDATGRLDGVVGMFERNGVMTVPLVGYDTRLPKRLGLYRMLMAIAMREAHDHRWLLHLSSGASGFKRLRGGEPAIEYTAVLAQHLSVIQRAVWRAVASILNSIGAPILRKYQL